MLANSGVKRSFVLVLESRCVAYQTNGNEAENTKQANILPSYTPTTLVCGQKVIFLKKVMLNIKLKGTKCRTLYK